MVKTIRGILRRGEGESVPPPQPPHEHCLSCGADLEGSRSYERYRVCHACGFHFHLSARERLATLLDPGSFDESDRGVTAIDPLSFADRHSYRSRVISAQRRTGLAEAALTGRGTLFGREIVVAVVDFAFLGGSIGVAAGERLARAFEKAASRRVAVVTVCSTSGTRMQEGLLALMQAPRVAAAARRHSRLGLPHISVVTDPTTGSAYAGFVNLADVIIAEPNALVGYAALRALQEEAGDDLPAGSHTSESHLQAGLIDAVVARPQLRDTLALLLDLLQSDYRLSAGDHVQHGHLQHSPHGAWAQVQLSRHSERPTAPDLIPRMTTSFFELHGDRMGTDDRCIITGVGSLAGEAAVIVGQNRPHTAGGDADGWVRPGGFRKAKRAMELAAKFNLPVVTLVDTAGAHPGIESEQAGLGHAIAECMATMLEIPVPTVAVITGEGNSEGAMALAVADRVLMLDNAVYEVIRPEEAARILFGEPSKAGEAAERLRITSHDCLRLGIADATVPEPGDGAHTNHQETAQLIRRAVIRELTRLQRLRAKKLVEKRYERYREIGWTRSCVRGTLERRLAHLFDRVGAAKERLRGRTSPFRRKDDVDVTDIPV